MAGRRGAGSAHPSVLVQDAIELKDRPSQPDATCAVSPIVLAKLTGNLHVRARDARLGERGHRPMGRR